MNDLSQVMWSGLLDASWLPPLLALCSLAGLDPFTSLECIDKSLFIAVVYSQFGCTLT